MDKTIEIIQVTRENIASHHICCALGGNADARACEKSKKDWMSSVFDDGYQFHRLDAQGKIFIETIPVEKAWCPIEGDGWLFIDCFWVSGKFKGQGVGSRLLQKAVGIAKKQGKKGLCALSADKKRPFLSDPAFYQKKGFTVADKAPPYYRLYALPFEEGQPLPRFRPADAPMQPEATGLHFFFSNHCPHTTKYAGLLCEAAEAFGAPVSLTCFKFYEDAKNSPNPFTTWAMFWNGEFVTNEILSVGKLTKFLESST